MSRTHRALPREQHEWRRVERLQEKDFYITSLQSDLIKTRSFAVDVLRHHKVKVKNRHNGIPRTRKHGSWSWYKQEWDKAKQEWLDRSLPSCSCDGGLF